MSLRISEKMMEHGELTRRLKDLLVIPEGEVSSSKVKQKEINFFLNWDLLGIIPI